LRFYFLKRLRANDHRFNRFYIVPVHPYGIRYHILADYVGQTMNILYFIFSFPEVLPLVTLPLIIIGLGLAYEYY